jgi:two-component system, OmpR family, response regulator VanR
MDEHQEYEKLSEKSILYVDDDELTLVSLAETLGYFFKTVFTAKNALVAQDILRTHSVDIILTDFNMPAIDGVEFIKKVRRFDRNTPVVFLSAHNDESILLEVIPLNASSYLYKPVNIDTLLKTLLTALLSSEVKHTVSGEKKGTCLLPNGVEIDIKNQMVTQGEEIIPLSKKEFELLQILIQNKNSIVSKEQLEHALWNGEYISEGSLKTLIKKVRYKIGDCSIQTIKNFGYTMSHLNNE